MNTPWKYVSTLWGSPSLANKLSAIKKSFVSLINKGTYVGGTFVSTNFDDNLFSKNPDKAFTTAENLYKSIEDMISNNKFIFDNLDSSIDTMVISMEPLQREHFKRERKFVLEKTEARAATLQNALAEYKENKNSSQKREQFKNSYMALLNEFSNEELFHKKTKSMWVFSGQDKRISKKSL